MAEAFTGIEMAEAFETVFGSTSNTTVANRIGTYIWPETSVRQEFYNSAVTGNTAIDKIYAKFYSGEYKSAKFKLTYREVYNLNTKTTVLTVIDSATVV